MRREVWRCWDSSVNHRGSTGWQPLCPPQQVHWRGEVAVQTAPELLMLQEPRSGPFLLQTPESFLCFVRVAGSTCHLES